MNVKEILLTVERHKDLADVLISLLGVFGAVVAAIAVVYGYFNDKADARKEQELNLRRTAYFDLFAAFPAQLKTLGSYLNLTRDPIVLQGEAPIAVFKLHLLGGQEAVRCIIERNALYHRAVIDLSISKNQALDKDESLAQLNGLSRTSEIAEGPDFMRHYADATTQRRIKWEGFLAIFRASILKLNENYRTLLPLARKEIGLSHEMVATLSALEKDEAVALEVLDGTLLAFKSNLGLVQAEPR